MGDMLYVALGISGGTIVLCGAWGLRCLAMGLLGYEELPECMTRRYWRRKFVRLVCRLAAIEAAWEKRKAPRKSGASRGTVGQRIRRTEYIYMDIVPQTDPHVKGLQVRKVKRY